MINLIAWIALAVIPIYVIWSARRELAAEQAALTQNLTPKQLQQLELDSLEPGPVNQ